MQTLDRLPCRGVSAPRNDVKRETFSLIRFHRKRPRLSPWSFWNNNPNNYYTKFTAKLGAWLACVNRDADACLSMLA